ncbi:hypothetical protein [Pseudonocardia sp. N23]|uniref:hypothetical protein n=1 Tax=Pseudonocardia sp. N23 TaxID=1987376 RepID=UPI000BFD7DD9|nr:hypothetical protein [Pseudonocardia sp. N23]GAY12018.1 hypothetical protein TOK_0408 [Pseudonocardia sp. N23]
MDGLGAIGTELISRFGVYALLLIGMLLIIRALRRDAEKVATRMAEQDEDHARERAAWRDEQLYLQGQIRDLRLDVEDERMARHAAEDAARAAGVALSPPASPRHRLQDG